MLAKEKNLSIRAGNVTTLRLPQAFRHHIVKYGLDMIRVDLLNEG